MEPGAAFVSILELSDAGEVVELEEEEGAVMSPLLDSEGAGVPEAGVDGELVVAELGAIDESVPVEVVAGVVTVLVVASLAGAWLLLLQPAKTRGVRRVLCEQ